MRVTVPMLRHQARLMARSLVEISRDPTTAGELPRLLATRGRSTMDLRLPWLPFRLIDDLTNVVGPGTRVFEYGGGGSTLWFLDRGASVVTVEHDPTWAGHLAARVTSASWRLLHPAQDADFTAYVDSIEAYDDQTFDVVVVDGRERGRCVAAAAPKVRRGGLLVVDDVDRPQYAAALDALGWPRRDVVGFAPAKPSLAYTAVLTRPSHAAGSGPRTL